jgi:hypothetical protein
MDIYLTLISNEDLQAVVTGTFDFGALPEDKRRGVLLIGAHCCLNGPVGTNKPTTFPVIGGPLSINGYVGSRISNNSWKGFCLQLANGLKMRYPTVCSGSQQMRVMGDLWPVAQSVSEARKGAFNGKSLI